MDTDEDTVSDFIASKAKYPIGTGKIYWVCICLLCRVRYGYKPVFRGLPIWSYREVWLKVRWDTAAETRAALIAKAHDAYELANHDTEHSPWFGVQVGLTVNRNPSKGVSNLFCTCLFCCDNIRKCCAFRAASAYWLFCMYRTQFIALSTGRVRSDTCYATYVSYLWIWTELWLRCWCNVVEFNFRFRG